VTCQPPRTLKFDFLASSSSTVPPRYAHALAGQGLHPLPPGARGAPAGLRRDQDVQQRRAVRLLCVLGVLLPCAVRAGKGAEDNLFDQITPDKVNKHLQTLMPGLTIKVFRTYNASITLSRLLKMTNTDLSVLEKKKEARGRGCGSLSCPHPPCFRSTTPRTRRWRFCATIRRGVNKNHDASMAKHAEKKAALEEELEGASGAAAERLRCVPPARPQQLCELLTPAQRED
jgi:Eukaryotic DNA topoisomerase I, catalytic core